MSTIQHSAVTGVDIHAITAFTFPSTAARDAQAVVAGDIGKVAHITVDNSFFVLTGVAPAVWSPIGGAPGVSLSAANTWTAGQRGAVVALTQGATVTPDFALSNNFSLTANQNFTLANPTNLVAGQSGMIAVTQDATGGRTIAWGTVFKAAGGTKPVLSTAANAVDYLSYYVESATRVFVSITVDVK